MPQGRLKHVYPGGNTSLGFYSYYSYIIDNEDAERKIIIKGGPGAGKSTFIRKIGNAMLERGYDVELMHCSSDNDSLDGVYIPALKVAIIDGTAPHVVDPRYPGAVDEIINFGSFWNRDGIKRYKKEIMKYTEEAGEMFSRAYRYLKAAACIYEDSRAIFGRALNAGQLNAEAEDMVNEFFGGIKVTEREGKLRKLFASAITPGGLCNYLDFVLATENVVEIKCGIGTCEEKLLNQLKDAALKRGLNSEAYYCALNPEKIEHLVIPDANISFTSSNDFHHSEKNKIKSIDMLDFMNKEIIAEKNDILLQNQQEIKNLLEAALQSIGMAKAIHDRLEKYYISNVDFNAVQECYERILKEIDRHV